MACRHDAPSSARTVHSGHLDRPRPTSDAAPVIVYAVVDVSLSCHLLGEDAERFIEEVRGDEPKLASSLQIEERDLEAGGRN
jgi:hypothetical protein